MLLSELWAKVSHPSTPDEDRVLHRYVNADGTELFYAALRGWSIGALWIPSLRQRPFLIVGGLAPGYVLDCSERLFVSCCWEASAELRAGHAAA